MNSRLHQIVAMESFSFIPLPFGTVDNHNKNIRSIFIIIVDEGRDFALKTSSFRSSQIFYVIARVRISLTFLTEGLRDILHEHHTNDNDMGMSAL